MSKFFNAYKQEIINHPREASYKPTNYKKFDRMKLYDVYKRVPEDLVKSDEDVNLLACFIEMSDYLHNMFNEMYKVLAIHFSHLNLTGKEIYAYIVAAMNREYKVVHDKRRKNMRNLKKDTYLLTDVMNFKMEAADSSGRNIDTRAALEALTDCGNLILNYLRFHHDVKFSSPDANPNEFAGRLIAMLRMVSTGVVFKQTYDDILYNDGFVHIDNDKKSIMFDYFDHNRLKVIRAGDLIFIHRRTQAFSKLYYDKVVPRISKHKTNFRIKKAEVLDGNITLKFGQGISKKFDVLLMDMQSAIDSFYEFLDGNMVMPGLAEITVDEAVVIWTACQYICSYVLENINFDISINTRKDFAAVPFQIKKKDLVDYIAKLTSVKRNKVIAVLDALTATTEKFNDIWSAPIYPDGDNYLLPFYPLIMAAPFHIFDQLLKKGGCDLDLRGKWFEVFLYKKLTETKTSYPIICIPSGKFESSGQEKEEIDLIVSLSGIVILIEAKCIHYSMERINYNEAWERLKKGCEQARRKADFVNNHP